MKSRLSLGVIGYGRWGANVTRDFAGLDGVKLTWIIDTSDHSLAVAKSIYPTVLVGKTPQDMLSEVDIVAVCTPASFHFEHAKTALIAGKHLFVEKPFSMHATQAEQLVALANQNNCLIMVGHQMLHHPAFLKAKEFVQQEGIGQIRSVVAERFGRVDFDKEPDVLWAYGPHDVAMLLSLLGEMPLHIRARDCIKNHNQVVQSVILEMIFPKQVNATVRLRSCDEKVRRLTVKGETGVLVFDDSLPGGRLLHLRADGSPEELAFVKETPLLRACAHFLSCIRDNEPLKTSGQKALPVIQVLEKAMSQV